LPRPIDILIDFVLPALIVAAGMGLAWWRGDGRWMGGVAVSAAFAVAYIAIGGKPRWPPGTGDASYWLIWFTVPTAMVGLIDALLLRRLRSWQWLRAALPYFLALVAINLLVGPLTRGPAGIHVNAYALSSAFIIWFVAWETLAEKNSGPTVPILMVLTLAATGLLLVLSANVKPSQGVVAMTGTAVVAAGLAWLNPKLTLDRGAILAWSVPLLGLLAFVHYYSYTEPPFGSVAMILCTPVVALVGELPAARRWSPVRRWTLRLVPVVLVLGAAVGLSVRQYFQAEAPAVQQSGPQDEL
jgi:hypothetical protein